MEKKEKRKGALALKTVGFPFICAVFLQYMSQVWLLLSMPQSDPGWTPFPSAFLKKMMWTVISLGRIGLGLLAEGGEE